jgi:hypothetical protein
MASKVSKTVSLLLALSLTTTLGACSSRQEGGDGGAEQTQPTPGQTKEGNQEKTEGTKNNGTPEKAEPTKEGDKEKTENHKDKDKHKDKEKDSHKKPKDDEGGEGGEG